jgi:two-component system cell cycle sensor histidine kinase/response regulator CckA
VALESSEHGSKEEDRSVSERSYRDLAENLVVGTYKTDLRGDIFYANDALADIFEFQSPAAMRAKRLLAWCKKPGEGGRIIEQIRRSGKVEDVEIEFVTQSGRSKSLLLSASLEGNGISGIIKDITDMRQLERQLIQAQKLESLGTLAGGIAHDFNNILAIIMGHSSMLERVRSDPAKFSQSVDAISKATVRGASLVKQLLTFAGQTDTVFGSVRINDIVTEVKRLLQETFPKTITISTSLQSNQPWIIGDPTQIHQVLLNLCINARDAMLKGGNLSISTGTVAGDSLKSKFPKAAPTLYVAIEVADTGIGMDEMTRHRIFEPFFTTKGPGKGTGLGLALVFGIVENHGGLVDVESKLGVGTTFTVYLPVQERTQEGSQPARLAAQDVPGGSETLLVIEDEETLRELLKAVLVSKGYTVMTAEDGKEGVEAFMKHQAEIAVVILDLGLPKLGGLEVFKRVREKDPEATVILASGFIDPETKKEVYEAGVKHFVQKPYSPDDVLKKIRHVIDAGRSTLK